MRASSFLFLFCMFFSVLTFEAAAQEAECAPENRACILNSIEEQSAKIEQDSWRDQTYRELAKTRAFEDDMAGALATLDKIQNPDTKALTIRGIGFAAADLKLPQERYNQIFTDLRAKAEAIDHPPSYAIALTYIAMGQAFAGDNDGAWATAKDMENDALRHKAYGETAEIQAENGDTEAALKSIAFIDSLAFRNKAYATVSKILAEQGEYQGALKAAYQIDNAYKKATAMQYILDQQKPRDVKK